jgi:hypothetical protein
VPLDGGRLTFKTTLGITAHASGGAVLSDSD